MEKQRFKANSRFWKKSISGIACASMVLANCNGGFLLNPIKAFADGEVSYLDATGAEQSASSYTTITSSSTTWNAGWYVADGDVTISDRVTTNGNVNLILKDGCSLTCSNGIGVTTGNSLTVYAQSETYDETNLSNSMGSLTATANLSKNLLTKLQLLYS